MPQLASYNFLGSDVNPLAAGFLGPSGAAMKLLSNLGQPTSLSQDEWTIYTTIGNWPNEQYSQGNIRSTGGTVGGGQGTGVCVRASPTVKTFYYAVVNDAATDNLEVAKYVNGVKTSFGFITTAWTDGDTLRLTVSGHLPTKLTVTRNANPIGSTYLDPVGFNVGNPGLFYSATATTSSYYDWRGGGEYTFGSNIDGYITVGNNMSRNERAS